ncbi:MAG: Hsp20/alpha crystallin family protein [Bacteroidales bacterium]
MKNDSNLPNVFNDFFGLDFVPQFNETTPKINVVENEREYRLEVATAGAKKENFTINLTKDGMLSIKFEQQKKSKEENKEERYLRKEFCYSKFEKHFTLPEEINKESITAKVENGILEVILPKTDKKPEEQSTQILIS